MNSGGARDVILKECSDHSDPHYSARAYRMLRLLWAAVGDEGPALNQPVFGTMVELSEFLKISTTKLSEWKKRGAPGMERGAYYPMRVLHWRRERPEATDFHKTGSNDLIPVEASGDLARAIFRTVRGEIGELLKEALPAIEAAIGRDDAEATANAVLQVVLGALAPLRLDDNEIEGVLFECWQAV